MAILSTKKRNSLRPSQFGLPKEGKYPMPDMAHAANAKARATQMGKAGKLSEGSMEKIDAKANRILHASQKETPMHTKEHHHKMAAHHHAKAAHHHEMAAKGREEKREHIGKKTEHKKVEHKKPEARKHEGRKAPMHCGKK